MTGRLSLAGLVLLAGVCRSAAAPTELNAAGAAGQKPLEPIAPLRATGSYVRRYWHIPLYRVTLELPDPQEVALRYLLSTGCGPKEPDWEVTAAFLLDPRNGIPVRLSMVMLVGLKGFRAESRTLRESLGRVGLEMDENWRLQGARELQGEVDRFAEAVIGLSEERPGPYYRHRRKGDLYVLSLDGNGGATLTYQPAADNRAARAGTIDFRDHRVLAAVARAMLLPAPGDEGASSSALLAEVREACASCESAGALMQKRRRGT